MLNFEFECDKFYEGWSFDLYVGRVENECLYSEKTWVLGFSFFFFYAMLTVAWVPRKKLIPLLIGDAVTMDLHPRALFYNKYKIEHVAGRIIEKDGTRILLGSEQDDDAEWVSFSEILDYTIIRESA